MEFKWNFLQIKKKKRAARWKYWWNPERDCDKAWPVLHCTPACSHVDMLPNIKEPPPAEKKRHEGEEEKEKLLLIHNSCFVASGGSTWAAAVRARAGLRTNKMLLSVCVCVYREAGAGQARVGWRRKKTSIHRGKREKEIKYKNKVGMEGGATESALTC